MKNVFQMFSIHPYIHTLVNIALELIDFLNKINKKCPLVYGCFFFLDFFSWLFVAADVLTPRTFCHHGRFVAMVVLSPDVLSLWTLCDGRLVAERFVRASNLYCSKRRSQLSADPIPESSASWYTDSTITETFFFLLHNVQC